MIGASNQLKPISKGRTCYDSVNTTVPNSVLRDVTFLKMIFLYLSVRLFQKAKLYGVQSKVKCVHGEHKTFIENMV